MGKRLLPALTRDQLDDVTISRFVERVDRRSADECWPWKWATTDRGYGSIWNVREQRSVRAHRIAHVLWKGPIPEGYVIDHLCRNRSCCNPAHLEVVSDSENILRGLAPTALNSAKDHCTKGHPLTPDNVYVRRSGDKSWRVCRTCRRDEGRERRERTRALLALVPSTTAEQVNPVQLARRFHETYERLAPSFGYETRQETREFDPDSPNGRLMIAVCSEILSLFPAGDPE